MDDELKAFRNYLRRLDPDALRILCRRGGLSEKATQYLVLYYGDEEDEQDIATSLNMGVWAYHNTKMMHLKKLLAYCRRKCRNARSYEEREAILDELIRN